MSTSKKKPLTTLLSNFIKASAKYVQAGMPSVSPEEYTKRLKACYECEHLREETTSCGICGCNMEVKAGWGTSSCPDTPPKWEATYGKK
tara:strand:+ start:761 stop:1027 length:267 start_codon:yes stop_codon:yes gene_type:complete